MRLNGCLAGHQNKGRAVIDAGSIACRHGTSRTERRLQRRELRQGGVGTRVLVLRDFAVACFDRNNFTLESPAARGGPLLAEKREFILCLTADAKQIDNAFCGFAHAKLEHRICQSIGENGVRQRAVAEFASPPHIRGIVRCPAHGFHASGQHQRSLSGGDGIGRQHHRLQPGSTGHVDRKGRRDLRHAETQPQLARHVHAARGLDHLAQNHLIDR